MMFDTSENGRLRFKRLEFELCIAEILEVAASERDLKWMTKCLVDSVQLVAWEIATDNQWDEWEDLYCLCEDVC